MKLTRDKLYHVLRNPFRIIIWLITRLPYFGFLKVTERGIEKISFSMWFSQKVMGHNRNAYWPVHKSSRVVGEHNIYVGIGTFPGFQRNIYVQGTGKLSFGDYTIIGQNSGILSGNHDLYDYRKLTSRDTKIGSYCWIGMNSTVLGGVVLGDHTIVSAGSVVTKSFPDGYCVIGGVPAKVIKKLDPEKVIKYNYEKKYHGYIPKDKFEKYRKKYLKI